MAISEILATIDSEIAELQQARALLAGAASPAVKAVAAKPVKKKKRKLSPEGRARIAAAAKARWATVKAAAKK
jgi:hypothetical protein